MELCAFLTSLIGFFCIAAWDKYFRTIKATKELKGNIYWRYVISLYKVVRFWQSITRQNANKQVDVKRQKLEELLNFEVENI